jgi:hypothetical protein
MGRHYKKRTSELSHSQQDLQNALTSINKGISFGKASANYNIPVSTLHDHTSGKLQFVTGRPTDLSNEEEEYTYVDWNMRLNLVGHKTAMISRIW